MIKRITILLSFVGLLLLIMTGCQTWQTFEEMPETVIETKPEAVPETISGSKTLSAQETEKISSVSYNEAENYAYSQLSEEEKELYKEIFLILDQMKEDEIIHTLDADKTDKVFQYVMMDHPEIFFVEGYMISKYTTNDIVTHLTFSGKYTVSREERKIREKKIKDYVNLFLQNAPVVGTDYEKMKYVYEYIIRNTEYSISAEDNQNICSVFINGKSVCQGYARATQYLLGELGVVSTMLSGTINTGESHAWNLVKMEDAYCYVDTTWGDASYQTRSPEETEMGIDYDYLGADDSILSKTHISDDYLKLPSCDSLNYYYYVKENRYFTAYREDELENLFSKGYREGWGSITIKCADDVVYSQMLQKLIEEERIFRFMERTGEIRYATMEEKQMLIIYL